MAFLRDPIWQFIGVIVALTALFIPTVLTILSRRKSLDFEIISDTPILSLKEEDKGQIQVLFNGKPLDNAHLIIMRIWNSGKIPIEIDDYNGQSIKLDFKVEVLDVAILEATPREVKENLAKDKDPAKIELKPILLNSQDSIELKILVNQAVSSIEIDAHIAGAKTAKQISLVSKPRFHPLSRRELMIDTTGLAGWIVAIASIAWFGYIQKPPPPPKAKGSLTPTQMSSPTSTQLIFSFEISDIYRHHTKGVFSVAWSRSGNYIASTGLDKTLQVWVPNGKNDSPLLMEKLFDTGESVTWSPDERYIATGDDSGFVRIWDLQQKKSIYDGRQANQLRSVAWSPDGSFLAFGTIIDAIVQVLDVSNLTNVSPLTTYIGHRRSVTAIAWSPDNKYIASGGFDWTVQVWNAFDKRVRFIYTGHSADVFSVAWSPDGNSIASGDISGAVHVWSVPPVGQKTTNDIFSFNFPGVQGQNCAHTLSWSFDSNYLAAGSWNKTILIVRKRDKYIYPPFQNHRGAIGTVAWSPHNQLIASASSDDTDTTVQIWQAIPL